MAAKCVQGPRCAIYTRKSTEEGLDQAFNSLDAQREACEAYIKSQAGEGWQLIRTRYDDGGFSGGTVERPALRQLLQDIAAGEVDTVGLIASPARSPTSPRSSTSSTRTVCLSYP